MRGGQANQSPTPETQQRTTDRMKLSSDQVREPCHLIYLWIELTDVAALFTEVEELKKKQTNKEQQYTEKSV